MIYCIDQAGSKELSDNPGPSVTGHNMIDYSDEAGREDMSDIPEPPIMDYLVNTEVTGLM